MRAVDRERGWQDLQALRGMVGGPRAGSEGVAARLRLQRRKHRAYVRARGRASFGVSRRPKPIERPPRRVPVDVWCPETPGVARRTAAADMARDRRAIEGHQRKFTRAVPTSRPGGARARLSIRGSEALVLVTEEA